MHLIRYFLKYDDWKGQKRSTASSSQIIVSECDLMIIAYDSNALACELNGILLLDYKYSRFNYDIDGITFVLLQ
jgi:hypothetical protein